MLIALDDQVYTDVLDEEIVLTQQVRAVILSKHPEVADFIDQIHQVLREPDEIRQSIRDDRVVLYYRYEAKVLDGKWLVVVVKQIDRNYVSTVYATDKVKSGEIIWTK
jgi:hypothetical protein